MNSHSLSGIISRVDSLQEQISLEKIQQASRSANSFKALHESLSRQICQVAEKVERNLTDRNLTAADLAIRSRRAYQWLKFLSDPEALSAHLDLLQRILLFLPGAKKAARKPLIHPRLALYHQGPLYKVRQVGRQLEISAQESFLNAPDRILIALLEIALDPSSKGARSLLREYTLSREYQQIREKLEYLGVPPGSFASGKTYHLWHSFQRVNEEYFQGKMARPHLVWSSRLTHRKFGHYQWDTDTVMVSSSLDQDKVPALVVDFVMYHELLHKKLGAYQANQNRIAHSRDFKEAENQFKQAEKARQLLNRIARKEARS